MKCLPYQRICRLSYGTKGVWFAVLLFLATLCIVRQAMLFSENCGEIRKQSQDVTLPSFTVDSNCKEQHDIVFLKIHKTASSTLANILQRFGLKRNLNFALPNKKPGEIRYNYFGDVGETIRQKEILSSRPNQGKYNIMYNHVIFNKEAFKKVFHGNMTQVTMLREPESQFLSAVLFFDDQKIYKAATTNITAFLSNPSQYLPESPYIYFIDNRQALDLGLRPEHVRNQSAIHSHIHVLDTVFQFVMIMEKFDESLILLKRLMCWSLQDILYIRKNPSRRTFDFHLTEYDRTLLRQWTLADSILYDHYRSRFNQILQAQPDVVHETKLFKAILRRTRDFCKGTHTNASRLRIKASVWNQAFDVTSLDCAYMSLNELEFLNKLLHDRCKT